MTLQYKIAKSPDFVFDYLTDMQKFVKAHPIIFQIDDLGEGNYKIHEKLKIGFIPVTFTYPAHVKGNKQEGKVSMKAIVMKINKIEMNFTISSEGSHTIISEQVTFNAILPIRLILQNIFKKQHTLLFANIEKN